MSKVDNPSMPLIAHVVYSLAVGGLENGLVNLINHMPAGRYRHVIICLTKSTMFKNRIRRQDVAIIDFNKAPGQDLALHQRFWRVLHQFKPDIVHTRNLPTLEFQLTSAMAGVRGRVHGEHGRDMYDLDGVSFKYNLLRKAMRAVVGHYTAVSADLARWLTGTIGVRSERLTQIYNGVDTEKFRPRATVRMIPAAPSMSGATSFVVGTVSRMEEVKDPLSLVLAFLQVIHSNRKARERLRLMMIGDGSLRQAALELLRAARAEELVWLPGDRDDVPDLLRSMDLFVLPSLQEGISNTILEAMASGLPVVATNVGGNPELVDNNTGILVRHSDPAALAEAIQTYLDNPVKVTNQGRAGRERVVNLFSMDKMVAGYMNTYDAVLRN